MLVLGFIIILFAAVFVWLIINSPGKPVPFVDAQGNIIANSIAEKGYIDVNGGKLGFFIKGQDIHNPVLLYLHGGMPDYFLTQQYPTGLDSIFTVVWWEQRGAGMSYNARTKDKKVSIDDLVSDTKAMTDYLRSRFGQDNIYLMAHSGGTYLGVKVIERYPELYTAYIGVAQITYQKLSEKLAYDYILEQYKKDSGKKKYYEIFKSHPVVMTEPIPAEYTRLRDLAMHDLGVGTMHNMKNVVTGLFFPSLLFKEYSLADKINLWKGKASSGISIMWNEMTTHDLAQENTTFAIPVYILHGIYDYTCSYQLSKQYFEKISAPAKGFYSFSNSAHSPIFEEPDECIKVIKENIINR